MIMDTIKYMLGIRRETSQQRETISALARSVAHEARELNTALKVYAGSDNPFMDLAIDLANKRAARKQMEQWDGQ